MVMEGIFLGLVVLLVCMQSRVKGANLIKKITMCMELMLSGKQRVQVFSVRVLLTKPLWLRRSGDKEDPTKVSGRFLW